MTIHREGYASLLITVAVIVILNVAVHFLMPPIAWVNYLVWGFSAVLFLIVLQFFRNPSIKIPVNPKHVLAPADGKVVVIEETEEPEYFQGKRKQVSIFMSPINVHVNRNPIAGIVKYFKYHPGKYLVAWHPKSSTENERTTIVIEHANGKQVLMRQIAGALAKRIVWYVKEDDNVAQGEEFGFIKFGSRVDLFLPLDAKINVNIDDVTKGGRTVVAEL